MLGIPIVRSGRTHCIVLKNCCRKYTSIVFYPPKARCLIYSLLTELLTKQWTKQAAAGGNNRTTEMNQPPPPLFIQGHCPITTSLGFCKDTLHDEFIRLCLSHSCAGLLNSPFITCVPKGTAKFSGCSKM